MSLGILRLFRSRTIGFAHFLAFSNRNSLLRVQNTEKAHNTNRSTAYPIHTVAIYTDLTPFMFKHSLNAWPRRGCSLNVRAYNVLRDAKRAQRIAFRVHCERIFTAVGTRALRTKYKYFNVRFVNSRRVIVRNLFIIIIIFIALHA